MLVACADQVIVCVYVCVWGGGGPLFPNFIRGVGGGAHTPLPQLHPHVLACKKSDFSIHRL